MTSIVGINGNRELKSRINKVLRNEFENNEDLYLLYADHRGMAQRTECLRIAFFTFLQNAANSILPSLHHSPN